MRIYLKTIFFSAIIVCNTFFVCQGQARQKELFWKRKVGGKIIGSAVIHHGKIFFGSTDGVIHVLDINSGKPVWQYKTNGEIASEPVVNKGLVYILSGDGRFYALRTDSGKLVWKFKTGGEHRFIRKTSDGKTYADIWDYYLSGAVTNGKNVYFGSSDGNIYCLNAQTGKMKWKFKTGNVVHATPFISDGKLFVGSFDGYFYALNASDGKLIWKFKTIGERYFPKGSIQKVATIYNGGVYFGSRDFNIYALNSLTGKGLWNYREPGSWIIATPTIYRGQVYFGTSDSHAFYSMNAETGKMNWKLNLNMRVYGSAVGYRDEIYFGCFNGYLYGVDIKTGKIVWRFQTDGSRKRYHTIYNKDGTFKPDFSIYGKTLKETEKNEEKIQSLGSIMDTPVIRKNILFFGSTDSTFYAVKLP